MFLLVVDGWTVLNNLVQVLTPIAIVVVLPVLVVWLIMRARVHEVDKKTEVLLKAVEKGAQIDPAFFGNVGPKKRTAKDVLMGYLITAMITGTVGLITTIAQVIFYSRLGIWDNGAPVLCVILSGTIFAVGIAFLIVYYVGKKTYAKELAELEDR